MKPMLGSLVLRKVMLNSCINLATGTNGRMRCCSETIATCDRCHHDLGKSQKHHVRFWATNSHADGMMTHSIACTQRAVCTSNLIRLCKSDFIFFRARGRLLNVTHVGV